MANFGGVWAPPECLLGDSWALLGAFSALLGASWALLGCLVDALGCFLAANCCPRGAGLDFGGCRERPERVSEVPRLCFRCFSMHFVAMLFIMQSPRFRISRRFFFFSEPAPKCSLSATQEWQAWVVARSLVTSAICVNDTEHNANTILAQDQNGIKFSKPISPTLDVWCRRQLLPGLIEGL